MNDYTSQELDTILGELTLLEEQESTLTINIRTLLERLNELKSNARIGQSTLCSICGREFVQSESSIAWNNTCPLEWKD